MATVHSLVCFGGRLGKTVTFTDAGDIVNLTKHGTRYGTGVAFSTTGALPTGLTAGTTYYARRIDYNTFTLHPTEADAIAGTNRVTFTGTGSGTHTVKGAYFLGLTAAQLARYGDSGSERIYDAISAWNNHRTAAPASGLDVEVCELGEAFTEHTTALLTISVPSAQNRIESKIDGVRSAAWHGGAYPTNWLTDKAAGFVIDVTHTSTYGLNFTRYRDTLDGVVVKQTSTYGIGYLVRLYAGLSCVKNSILIGYATNTGGGVIMEAGLSECHDNLITNIGTGVYGSSYYSGLLVANNTIVKNNVGVAGGSTMSGLFYNNIVLGNTTNWTVTTTYIEAATQNASLAGEAPIKGTGTRITIATTDFVDWANNDFRPASASSPQVDVAVPYYGLQATDLADDERPNYNNGGTEAPDVGCYEFDHGYGDHPATSHISLTNIVSGSRVLITRDDTSAVLYNDVPGASLNLETGYIGKFTVKIRKGSASPVYREFTAGGTTVADQTTSIKVLQQLDE